ncbi:hypothetical protein E2562_027219 [Oryza meyeriana var. granulata]|uniref:Uncharacterized protein n=1 Tax=Oryza meyeriana var. granulata TaxID=110450 RepID=A0A6G1EZQ5_9ORYZ|nr:hypothetical protein E2562_008085 [Oryza meyeriana var. granulata]KAF0930052.1 hypothetical protein E2562_027219 [Oryza meyeriana var. granulata]
MKHFTTKTDIISVLRYVFHNTHQCQWQSTVLVVCSLVFLVFTEQVVHLNGQEPSVGSDLASSISALEFERGVDKADFAVCAAALPGVVFSTMITGLGVAVAISVLRALLHVARPATSKLGHVPGGTDDATFRDVGAVPRRGDRSMSSTTSAA